MSIFDTLLGIAQPQQPTPAQQPQQTPTQPGAMPSSPEISTEQNPGTQPNGIVPEQSTIQKPESDSPLAKWEELWETPSQSEENTDLDPNALVPLNAKDVQEVASKANLTSGITAEDLAGITEGGEAAQTALLKILQTVSANTLTQATLVNDKLAQANILKAIAGQEANLPALVRANAVQAHLTDSNPLFDNPAIQPVIQATQAQLQEKFPNATPAELTKMTQEYITAMGEAFAPKSSSETTPGEPDWSKFLTN